MREKTRVRVKSEEFRVEIWCVRCADTVYTGWM